MPADITKEYDVMNLLKQVHTTHGGLDVLLNCTSMEKKQNIYDFEQKRSSQLVDIQAILKVLYKAKSFLHCKNDGKTISFFLE